MIEMLIHLVFREHSDLVSQIDFHLQLWLFDNAIHKSHDPTLLYHTSFVFIVLIKRPLVAETGFSFK